MTLLRSTWKAAVLFLIVFSCRSSPSSTEQVPGREVDIDAIESRDVLDRVARMEVVELESTVLLGSIDKVAARAGRLYVFDGIGSQLFVYDRKGKLLRRIGEKGSGPGRYKKIHSVSIPPESDRVFVLAPWKIHVFDSLGAESMRIDLKKHPGTFTHAWGDDRICYTTKFEDPEYYVRCIDLNGQVVNSFLPYPKDLPAGLPALYDLSGQVSANGNRVFAYYPTTSEVYELKSDGSVAPFIRFVGNDIWPGLFEEDVRNFIRHATQLWDISFLNRCVITDKVGVFTFHFNRNRKNCWVFFDSDEIYLNNEPATHPLQVLLNNMVPAGTTEDGGFFFVLAQGLRDYANDHFDTLEPLVPQYISRDMWDQINEKNSNPLLLIVYFDE